MRLKEREKKKRNLCYSQYYTFSEMAVYRRNENPKDQLIKHWTASKMKRNDTTFLV